MVETVKEVGEALDKLFAVVRELDPTEQPGEQKRLEVAKACAELVEEADDIAYAVAGFIPGYLGGLAREGIKQIVDNPTADAWEKAKLAEPMAQGVYDLYLKLRGILEPFLKLLGK